jgi:hypothetical protein
MTPNQGILTLVLIGIQDISITEIMADIALEHNEGTAELSHRT